MRLNLSILFMFICLFGFSQVQNHGQYYNQVASAESTLPQHWIGQKFSTVQAELLKYYYSTDGGSTWDSTTVSYADYYTHGGISEDGQYSVIIGSKNSTFNTPGTIYYSQNYGATISASSANVDYMIMGAISKSGQYMYATNRDDGGDYIYRSNNYGSTWTEPSTTPLYAIAVRCSSNGSKVYAHAQYTKTANKSWYSTDYGATYTSKTTGGYPFSSFAAADTSLSYIYSVRWTTTTSDPAQVYKSTDQGSNWTICDTVPTPTGGTIVATSGHSIKCDNSGQYVYASFLWTISAVNYYVLYRSDDYGENFSQIGDISDAAHISYHYYKVSPDGKYVYAYGATNDVLYISDDYGVNFTETTQEAEWGVKMRHFEFNSY